MLKASKEIYEALKAESGEDVKSYVEVDWKNGKMEIRIKAKNVSSLQASINGWLRLYKCLSSVEEVIDWQRK